MRDLLGGVGRVVGSWVLWSPRRAIGVVVGLLVLLAALGSVTKAGHQQAHAVAPVATATASPAPATSLTPDPLPPPAPSPAPSPVQTSSPSSAVPSDGLRVAYSFVVAWARPKLRATEWRAGVNAYASPRLARLLAYTDPARVPAHTVRGPAVLSPGGAVALVPTDGGQVRVTLIRAGGRTVVDSIGPAL